MIFMRTRHLNSREKGGVISMKCLSIESRIITCSSVSVDSLLLALSRIRRCERLFALLFVMESKYSAGLCFYRVAVVSLFKFTLSALPLPRQSPGSCCSISHSIADEGGTWKARWEGESSICSRVMKERRVVMKERAIPGPRARGGWPRVIDHHCNA